MSADEIAIVLTRLGCPPEKAPILAAQLSKRADQLAAQKNRTREDALAHLLKLMVDSGGFKE
ncbi:MAG TPA: hypothetical protein VHB20_08015 [Verrucomicrobiae bacterium]|nr:hypothetical protein [Verrucomicrobiae bacterium]